MEYISAEEFLKQPKEVREVFLNWWNPSVGDLYYDKAMKDGIRTFERFQDEEEFELCAFGYDEFSFRCSCIPLLTEGQLCKFIEDKTNNKLVFDYYTTSGYRIVLYKNNIRHTEIVANEYDNLGKSLIQAYWKVAVEIAKEG